MGIFVINKTVISDAAIDAIGTILVVWLVLQSYEDVDCSSRPELSEDLSILDGIAICIYNLQVTQYIVGAAL